VRTLVRIIRGLKSSLQTDVNYGLLRVHDITLKKDLSRVARNRVFSNKTASKPLMLVKNPVSLVIDASRTVENGSLPDDCEFLI
jgi:hypothetical protein